VELTRYLDRCPLIAILRGQGAWGAGGAGFGIGSAIYKPGDTPELVAAKARALRAA
jgi:2-dehydro-3-deoxyphosphogalactonate aldolase